MTRSVILQGATAPLGISVQPDTTQLRGAAAHVTAVNKADCAAADRLTSQAMRCRFATSSGNDNTHSAAALPLKTFEVNEYTCMCTHQQVVAQWNL